MAWASVRMTPDGLGDGDFAADRSSDCHHLGHTVSTGQSGDDAIAWTSVQAKPTRSSIQQKTDQGGSLFAGWRIRNRRAPLCESTASSAKSSTAGSYGRVTERSPTNAASRDEADCQVVACASVRECRLIVTTASPPAVTNRGNVSYRRHEELGAMLRQ